MAILFKIFSKLPNDIDVIVHLASQQPSGVEVSWDDLYKGNVISTLRLWDYAEEIGVKKFIYISSTSLFNKSSVCTLAASNKISCSIFLSLNSANF